MTDYVELDRLAEELTLRIEVDKFGTIRYYNSNNQIHRIHGPAVVYNRAIQIWYQNGKMHRLDGPALIWPDGPKEWYIDDKPYTEERFNAHPLVIEYARSKS